MAIQNNAIKNLTGSNPHYDTLEYGSELRKITQQLKIKKVTRLITKSKK